MIAAVGGVVGGSVLRLWNEKANHHAAPVATAPGDPQGNPATQPAENPATDASSLQKISPVVDAAPQTNAIELWARDATLHGNLQLAAGPPARQWKGRGRGVIEAPAQHLTGFSSWQDCAEWTLEIRKAGEYEISLNYGCAQWQQAHFQIKVGDSEVRFASEGSRYEGLFRVGAVGRITLPAGKTTLTFRAAPTEREQARLNLREVQLIPTFTE
jgi:hypothetical protein